MNVESGLNDGLALPFVVAFTAWAGHRDVAALSIFTELTLGIAVGIAVPWAGGAPRALSCIRRLGAIPPHWRVRGRPPGVRARGKHAQEFLAAFSAGATLATVAPRAPAAFAQINDTGAELLKLAALLVFGSMLSPRFLGELGVRGWAFGLVALFAVRPLAVALARSPLGARERAVAAWFGPKGFASVVYGLLIVSSAVGRSALLFHLIAITTALSIVLHSSTDVPVARWLERSPHGSFGGVVCFQP